jgi:FkbM family methyltransferase
MSRIREFIGRAWPGFTAYVCCFGIARGSYYLIMSRLWPRSRGRLAAVQVPGFPRPLLIRRGGTDAHVFTDIYVWQEYGYEFGGQPEVIVDAGAYSGLSTAFFAHRFPDAKIIAIEPGQESFDLLVQNTAAFPNVQPLQAALWTESGTVSLSDPGDGAWGIRVTESTGSGPGGSGPAASGSGTAADGSRAVADGSRAVAGADPVRAVTVTDVMREFGLGTIDLLKVDIEGSEKELFAAPGDWIEHVDAICMELHDRFKPGCTRTFFGAVEDFAIEVRRGEDVLVLRDRARLAPPVAAGRLSLGYGHVIVR